MEGVENVEALQNDGEDSKPVEADPTPEPEKDAPPVESDPTPDPADVTTHEEDDDPESLVGEEVPDE